MQLTGRILTRDGFRSGTVRFDQRIRAVELGPVADAGERWILPGFVDAHVHGGGGGDTMDGEEGLRAALRLHAHHGTTSMVPTTLTAPFAALEAALIGVRSLIERPEPGGARVLGAHLEGPWIAPGRLGAQPPHARIPDDWEVDRLLELVPVRVVTLAPEIEGGLDLIEKLTSAGVRVQIGHSDADAATTREALDRGAAGFTHLFNAMGGFRHRDPGVAGAALAWGESAELIVDGHHLSPEAVEIARRCLPHWYCVSDAIESAGMPDGEYRLGGRVATVRGGACRLADGTLAGSSTTLHDSLRRLVGGGLPIEEAVRRVSGVPAAALGIVDRGRIEAGVWADLVVTGPDLEIEGVWLEGRALDLASAAASWRASVAP